ncbi:MAG: NAD(P)H-hydrate dehydratase [Tannerellaceae bacterium]|jgi:NAD(P)H-hydrate epimerase|nr:NAD(P)H-hydrate dehydratase [Tannerellaceae bacterium]
MIKIFTNEQLKEIDKYTIANEPIQAIDLIERAAQAFVSEFLLRYNPNSHLIIFAGQGNNGADALAIARLLIENRTFNIEIFLFNPHPGKISPECELSRQKLLEALRDRQISGSKNQIFNEVSGGNFFPPLLKKGNIVIDGLFGSGLNRPLQGGFAAIVKYINASEATILSIDIPSGLMGEDNSDNIPEAIIRANLTLTFGFPKLSFLLSDTGVYAGKWKTLDIGLHPTVIKNMSTPFTQTTEEDAASMILHRPKFSHKGTFGHALLIAGSRGKLGAALLAAQACLKSGAGLLTTHIPTCGEYILQTSFPETMLSLDHNKEYITSMPNTAPFAAVGAGPGLGQNSETATALKAMLQAINCPLVLDADALNIIAAHSLMPRVPAYSILTPHAKEFDRLCKNESASSYERLEKALTFAMEHAVVLVLKGPYTAVCTPDGEVLFNSSGNSGLATAGSGDVLTGIILGLLTSGYQPETAAVLGVFIHGMAGDIATASVSEESLIASDIINNLGKTFKQLKI